MSTSNPGARGYWRDWLPPMMRAWATQYARALNAGRWVRSATGADQWHFDGLPLATLLGKIRAEGEGAGQGSVRNQRFDEVYHGDGLIIWRAMSGMRIEQREVIHAKYLCRGGYRDHCRLLGISKTAYWGHYNEGHAYIAGRVPLIEEQLEMLKLA